MNNYERIKQMNVDEMALLLNDPPHLRCDECAHEEDCHDLDIHCPTVSHCHLVNWLLTECE